LLKQERKEKPMTTQATHPAAAPKLHEVAPHHPEHQPAHQPAHHEKEHAAAPKIEAGEPPNLDLHWKAVGAKMREQWSALTSDDLHYSDKTKAALVAMVHKRTGLDADTAERQIDALLASLSLVSE
jgi:hypothetical protein